MCSSQSSSTLSKVGALEGRLGRHDVDNNQEEMVSNNG